MVVVGQKVARKHDRGFGVGIDGRSNGLDREQDRGKGGCRCCRCGIPGFGLCAAIGRFTPGPVPVRWLQQQTRPWVLDGSRVGPVPPGQQERKQAEKCIARHAHLPAQAASWASHSPRPRRRRGGPREAQAVGRARPDMRNQNQNGHGCKNPDSVSGIDAAGISTGIVGRASVRLMAAPPRLFDPQVASGARIRFGASGPAQRESRRASRAS